MGLGELETITYETNRGFAGVTVATLNDVPLLDERSRVEPAAIEQIEERYGVQLEETGTTTLELANRDAQVQGTEYDVQGAPAEAKAVLFPVDCDPFVLVVAYGLAGSGFGASYQDAQDVGRHVVCPP